MTSIKKGQMFGWAPGKLVDAGFSICARMEIAVPQTIAPFPALSRHRSARGARRAQ